MWLLFLVIVAALFALVSVFAFPPAIPIVAIVVFVLLLVFGLANGSLLARKGREKAREDGDEKRNWRGEVTDLGYRDRERRVPRTQRAIFVGTPEWEREKREKREQRSTAAR
jgi:hypothetical protein